MTEFVLMMTRDDVTVPDALETFQEIAQSGVRCVGFKDIGIDEDSQAQLVNEIRENGCLSFLEVVDLTEEGEKASAEAAIRSSVDYLVGGTRIEETLGRLDGSSVRYMPYVGNPVGHPARLVGEIDTIVDEAKDAEQLGVAGVNLLAYRYEGDPLALTEAVVGAVDIPVLAAGSVNGFERIEALCEIGVWGFTIGGAVMDRSLVDGSLTDQIEAVLRAVKANSR